MVRLPSKRNPGEEGFIDYRGTTGVFGVSYVAPDGAGLKDRIGPVYGGLTEGKR